MYVIKWELGNIDILIWDKETTLPSHSPPLAIYFVVVSLDHTHLSADFFGACCPQRMGRFSPPPPPPQEFIRHACSFCPALAVPPLYIAYSCSLLDRMVKQKLQAALRESPHWTCFSSASYSICHSSHLVWRSCPFAFLKANRLPFLLTSNGFIDVVIMATTS